jgi:hypothetical protein
MVLLFVVCGWREEVVAGVCRRTYSVHSTYVFFVPVLRYPCFGRSPLYLTSSVRTEQVWSQMSRETGLARRDHGLAVSSRVSSCKDSQRDATLEKRSKPEHTSCPDQAAGIRVVLTPRNGWMRSGSAVEAQWMHTTSQNCRPTHLPYDPT